jgi:hypothetical protein
MRGPLAWFVSAAAIGLLLAGPLRAQDNYQASDPNVDNIVRFARMAVGGGAVSKLKALEFKGKSKVEMNGFLIDCTVDIKILLPDHYLRVDMTPTDAKLAGYAGKTILNAIRAGANLSLPPENLNGAILKNERTRLARFLLGSVTYFTPDTSLVFHSSGLNVDMVDPRVKAKTSATVEGRGEPNVADITSRDGFAARLTVDASNKWPVKLQYPSSPSEETMTFTDRRDVSGLKIPFRVTTTTAGRTIDELIFNEVLVNPEIGKGDFKR